MSELQKQIDTIKRGIAKRKLSVGPVVTEAEVSEFETMASIRLPEEFRQFLLQVGNGGDGPGTSFADGMYCLGEYHLDHRSPAEVISDLSRPFPFTEYWSTEDDEEFPDHVWHGSLPLSEEGCGMWWHLIVTGPARGQIWQSSEYGIQPCAPNRDFLSWYSYWLAGGDDWWAEF